MPERSLRWLLLPAALGLAIVGQFYFALKPDFVWDGVIFYLAAVALFLAAVRTAPAPARSEPRSIRLAPEVLVRGLPVAAGLLLGLLAVLQLTEPHRNYWPIFWTWIAASVLYLLGFARRPAWLGRGRLAAASRVLVIEWSLVALVVALALLLRAWHVDSIPWTLGGDEGSQGLWARSVIEGKLTNMFGLGWLSVPNLSFYFQAGWLRLVGDSVLGLRLPWAVVGTVTVLGAYLLVRRLFGWPAAFLTAFLLAAYHFHIHFSRLGSNQIADALFMVWALYFLVLGRQAGSGSGRRRWAWAAVGMLAGLSFYFYAGARQVPLILLAVIAYAMLLDPSFWREHKLDLLVMLGGFLVVFGPMGLAALQHMDDFNARINAVGIFQSGWLEREALITGRSRLTLLFDQVQRAFLAFNLYPDRVSWYGANIPLLDFAASIFFVLGAAFSGSRMFAGVDKRDGEAMGAASLPHFPGWRYGIFVIWFVFVVAVGGALTQNPPASQRLVSSAVPTMFFVAVALLALARSVRGLLASGTSVRPALANCLPVVLAAALALISVRYYFGPYQDGWVYGNSNAEVATRIGYYLRDLQRSEPGVKEFFFGAPRMYADFGSTPFIAAHVPLYDVVEPLAGPWTAEPAVQAVFIFLPERAGELHWVEQAYPGGTVEEIHRLDDPAKPLLFVAYHPPSPPAS